MLCTRFGRRPGRMSLATWPTQNAFKPLQLSLSRGSLTRGSAAAAFQSRYKKDIEATQAGFDGAVALCTMPGTPAETSLRFSGGTHGNRSKTDIPSVHRGSLPRSGTLEISMAVILLPVIQLRRTKYNQNNFLKFGPDKE